MLGGQHHKKKRIQAFNKKGNGKEISTKTNLVIKTSLLEGSNQEKNVGTLSAGNQSSHE